MTELIPEDKLIEFFNRDGKSYLDACRTAGSCEVAPGKALHYEIYRSPKTLSRSDRRQGDRDSVSRTVLVICHGFTESCAKYHELIYYFLKNGYDIFIYDHRGHGHSFRESASPDIVHVQNFDRDYVNDLDFLVQNIVRPAFPGCPLLLYGHSMGGCVALRYLELHPDTFCRCVLSSPMVGIITGGIPMPFARALAWFMKRIGRGKARIIGQQPYHPNETFEASASMSEARFLAYHELRKQTPAFQQCSGDYAWFAASAKASAKAICARETAKIKIPVLLCEAENDSYVRKDRVAKLRKNLSGTEYHLYPNSKHEIYTSTNDVLQAYLDDVLQYYLTASSFCEE